MRQFRKAATNDDVVRLIREVLAVRAPEKLARLFMQPHVPLGDDERDELRGVLADELIATGLDSDDEHSARGHLIEDAIDWLGHR